MSPITQFEFACQEAGTEEIQDVACSTAHAVAERVCRDHTLVGNPEGLKATMKRLFADAASHRQHNY